jgi:phage-related protein
VAVRAKAPRAGISPEGDSRQVLREWPKDIRNDFGTSLDAVQGDAVQGDAVQGDAVQGDAMQGDAMQEGKTPRLPIRPMPSVAAGVFELKDDDENKWCRLVYLAGVKETLHCFEKDAAKTEKRDLAIEEKRW